MGGDGLFTAYNDEPNWHKAHNLLMPAFIQAAMRRYHPVIGNRNQLPALSQQIPVRTYRAPQPMRGLRPRRVQCITSLSGYRLDVQPITPGVGVQRVAAGTLLA